MQASLLWNKRLVPLYWMEIMPGPKGMVGGWYVPAVNLLLIILINGYGQIVIQVFVLAPKGGVDFTFGQRISFFQWAWVKEEIHNVKKSSE